MTHIIHESFSPPEALVWKTWCGLEVVALDDGTLIPPIDFYHENAADKATCPACVVSRLSVRSCVADALRELVDP